MKHFKLTRVVILAISTWIYSSSYAAEHDSSTKVYCDRLYFRVHAESCELLILKEKKKTMTLAEADKAGADIPECCFAGYKRKHPLKPISDDDIVCGPKDVKRRTWHVAGCHRYSPSRDHARLTRKEAKAAKHYTKCKYCGRVTILATVSDEEWNKLPSSNNTFVAPKGWVPKPYSPDIPPSKEELEILIQETLSRSNGIQELQFTDPIATLEHFHGQRFFFPVTPWLFFYKAYRSTGDTRLLDKLLESARHYHSLCLNNPSVAQSKASTPEGMPFMYSMAACARITLQLARKQSGVVGKKDIGEAEAFLKTMISVLKPTCEGDDSLDPELGIPRKLADDFRLRAFNRAMNGIGTLSMITAALEDLQALTKTKAYRPTIDRYRKVIQEYIKYWVRRGHYCAKIEGEKHFVYPYAPREPNPRMVDGCPIFHRAEDTSHYSHTLQGLMCLYEATPELGIDDDFMTAVANAVYRSSTVKVQLGKTKTYSGHIECPTAARMSPKRMKGKYYSPARDRFYLLEAFRNGLIDALCVTLNEQKRAAMNGEYERRLATLHTQYMKALRKDRSLVHLGEKK